MQTLPKHSVISSRSSKKKALRTSNGYGPPTPQTQERVRRLPATTPATNTWTTFPSTVTTGANARVGLAGSSIDGYNWGKCQSWSSWQTFSQVFKKAYNALANINKPLFIAEISSSELGGNKAEWITDMFEHFATDFSRVFAVMWFSQSKEDNEGDWALNTSQAAQHSSRPEGHPTVPFACKTASSTCRPAKH